MHGKASEFGNAPHKSGSGTAMGRAVIERLIKRYGIQKTMLKHKNIVELFVATILSPQCTDKQVNNVTKTLFKKYKTPSDYANASLHELRRDIMGINYYNTKAKNLRRSMQIIASRFGGKVPDSIDKLMELPGVGRKVANVILANGFGIASGIAIDTHCITVANRLGLARSKDPKAIERSLMSKIPKKYWLYTSNLFIALGRDTCRKNEKRCSACVLNDICPSSSVKGEKVLHRAQMY